MQNARWGMAPPSRSKCRVGPCPTKITFKKSPLQSGSTPARNPHHAGLPIHSPPACTLPGAIISRLLPQNNWRTLGSTGIGMKSACGLLHAGVMPEFASVLACNGSVGQSAQAKYSEHRPYAESAYAIFRAQAIRRIGLRFQRNRIVHTMGIRYAPSMNPILQAQRPYLTCLHKTV